MWGLRVLYLVLVAVPFICFAAAQSGATGFVNSSDVVPSYRLGKGDLIEISVFGVEEFRYSVRIGSSGTITLPFVGELTANGLTVNELAGRLEAAMDGSLFRDPEVLVAVKEFRSNPIIVLGAVNKPGSYHDKTGEFTLLDLLAEVGGVTPSAGDSLVIQRYHADHEEEPEIIRLSLDDLLNKGVASLNMPVLEGDVITVPIKEKAPPGVFYVIGDVGRPGVFELPLERKVFLSQAVAAAGGPLRTAKPGKGMLVRYDDTGQRQEIAVNFKQVLKGKKPDIEIQSKDIIFIPGSSAKTIGYGLLGLIPSTIGYAANSSIAAGINP